MGLDKTTLIDDIKAIQNTLKNYDGETAGQTQADAIDYFASNLADAIDKYVKTADITTNSAQIATSVMVAAPTPVTIVNTLNSTIS